MWPCRGAFVSLAVLWGEGGVKATRARVIAGREPFGWMMRPYPRRARLLVVNTKLRQRRLQPVPLLLGLLGCPLPYTTLKALDVLCVLGLLAGLSLGG
jgi:hypothetical protein